MAIRVELDVMLARRKMSVGELAERVGITPVNISVLKNGRAKAVRFSTLDALCSVLECQPGDILVRTSEADNDDNANPEGPMLMDMSYCPKSPVPADRAPVKIVSLRVNGTSTCSVPVIDSSPGVPVLPLA